MAGDLNAKTMGCAGNKTDKRGITLMEVLCKHGLFPIRLRQKYTYISIHQFSDSYRRTSCSDVISADNHTTNIHENSKVLIYYSTFDHYYILQKFKTKISSSESNYFKFSTEEFEPEDFIKIFDDIENNKEVFNNTNEAAMANIYKTVTGKLARQV